MTVKIYYIYSYLHLKYAKWQKNPTYIYASYSRVVFTTIYLNKLLTLSNHVSQKSQQNMKNSSCKLLHGNYITQNINNHPQRKSIKESLHFIKKMMMQTNQHSPKKL